ncbi:2',3'-cyclic-nucleotide 2'-phosphodiesterase/5'- or 3'-nucleotidase, 5'-nucleotidase family [Geosmithia morbida]|uniref:2',3'-cyclic-nucleotide 2'-phosphodiesterase/5'-or 3'-nucleotidase, 5'-nucleotidase family n=1 Tax=Geosmithia morbida TaxID=1094350 RepID=A0A9P4YRR6_9HYPO|nr:2',3'-cyclic-nucleotide 2'-phosphodiesterase/5'- or 3'-nucleotidase, 5'-nucleotidase family [Geosmithia morbida]KAF4121911.1 2',3'-cyclic-nucleotide 2'-phosphodiesterase/5'- or 3'-nucleotidase, 5'-nucleotidase family [Geosmithia morbida]
MKPTIISLVASLGAFASFAAADDVLYSRRASHLNRRFIDEQGNWNVSFFHINDVHAHLDEFNDSGTDCEEPEEGCYGGYARIKTKVNELKQAHPDHLWLNDGDEFQGTLFYSYYGPEKIAETVNDLGFDIGTLGNHEWDGGDEELGRYIENLTFPIVSCNVKSEYPLLKNNIKNYHIFEDKNLAVIGATTDDTPTISSVGKETKFLDPIEEVQKSIDEIREKYPDVKYIVALTHIGYDVDQELAKKTEGLSLIIGGHSHTLLGDMEDAEGKYPTIVEDKNGDEVFIVTSYRWGEYLGSINVLYDTDGKITAYHGAPIHMTNTTEQDEELQEKIESWRGPFEEFAAEVVGTTDTDLVQETCQDEDCLLGQVMADAMLEYRVNQTEGSDSEKPDFALINAGVVRAAISKGNITRGEILTSFPFGNTVVQLTYTGKELLSILEGCVSMVNQETKADISSWFQISDGLVVEYNPDNVAGKRLVSAKVNGEAIVDGQNYEIVTLDFLAGGGDSILVETSDFTTLDAQDQVLVDYVEAHTPLSPKLAKRVVKVDGQASDSDSDDTGSNSDETDEVETTDGNQESSANMIAASMWVAVAAVMVSL